MIESNLRECAHTHRERERVYPPAKKAANEQEPNRVEVERSRIH
jgi:hypothetical protein